LAENLTFRRLSGLDRSGPNPQETTSGQPLRPWTLPNLVTYLRIVALPVFLVIGLGSGDGREDVATAIYAAICWGDYADGMLARVTRQYSRLGALLDPFVDRATILAGAAVCWRFELLPRWALAALAVREVVTMGLAELALRRGLELRINWFGRIGIWPVMSAIFFAMALQTWASEALLLLGLGLSTVATAEYLWDGIRATGDSKPSTST
jgi:phosphatidylglycerophosphate synthase